MFRSWFSRWRNRSANDESARRSVAPVRLQTADEWRDAAVDSVESGLNPAMKVFIDSMDTYSTKHAQQSTSLADLVAKSPPDVKVFLREMYDRHVEHVVKQMLIRQGQAHSQWLPVIVSFALHASWTLQVDPSCSSILDMTHVVAFGSGSELSSCL